jgi:hypothetical protein
MDGREIGWKGIDCIYLVQDGDKGLGCCEHSNELQLPYSVTISGLAGELLAYQ